MAEELGLRHVEVSDGTIALEPEAKAHLIRTLTPAGFTVLAEVGSKDADFIMAPTCGWSRSNATWRRARGR